MSTPQDKIKTLQQLVGAKEDSIIGNETLTKFQCKYNLPNKAIVAQFFANIWHETGGLKVCKESLNYSSKRMLEIFGKGKHSAKLTPQEANYLVGKPYEFAERVYGLGNPTKAKDLGNKNVGDGFKYIGRGSLQITGRYSYNELQNSGLIEDGDNVLNNPELVEDKYFWQSAINYFNKRGLWTLVSSISDADTEKLRKRVNGGLNGIAEVKAQVKRFYAMFK